VGTVSGEVHTALKPSIPTAPTTCLVNARRPGLAHLGLDAEQ